MRSIEIQALSAVFRVETRTTDASWERAFSSHV